MSLLGMGVDQLLNLLQCDKIEKKRCFGKVEETFYIGGNLVAISPMGTLS